MLEHDPLHQFIETSEKGKQQHELDRLLCVACTRARKSLHLVGNVKTDAAGESLREPTAGSLLQRMWPAVESLYNDEFAKRTELSGDNAADTKTRFLAPLSRRYSKPWQAADIPPLPIPSDSDDDQIQYAEQKVPFYWVGALARQAGTVVHRWLQHLTTSGDIHSAGDSSRRSAQWARQIGIVENDIDELCTRVTKALDGIINDDKGRWLLEGEGFSELPLTGLWHGRITSIIIDRVRIAEDGTHWIVDYKTSTHEGGDLATFLQQETERYRNQLQKYAHIYAAMTGAPVRTALYFPMLQEFCEV
jgi:ATP-dependent exoDNAse (exonuclease V) beta subunit